MTRYTANSNIMLDDQIVERIKNSPAITQADLVKDLPDKALRRLAGLVATKRIIEVRTHMSYRYYPATACPGWSVEARL